MHHLRGAVQRRTGEFQTEGDQALRRRSRSWAVAAQLRRRLSNTTAAAEQGADGIVKKVQELNGLKLPRDNDRTGQDSREMCPLVSNFAYGQGSPCSLECGYQSHGGAPIQQLIRPVGYRDLRDSECVLEIVCAGKYSAWR